MIAVHIEMIDVEAWHVLIRVGGWQANAWPGSIRIEFVDECTAELDGDGEVAASDMGALLSKRGPCVGCAADLNGDGVVNAEDMCILLRSWGLCG